MSAINDPNNQQTPPPPPAMDGLMRISKQTHSETIKIEQFILEPAGVSVNEIMLEVEYRTSTFAVAAMLKGLNEFYFKPAGMISGDRQALTQSEHNLKVWEELCQKANSKIIMP